MSMDAERESLDEGARITVCVATRDRPEHVERHLLPSVRRLPGDVRTVVVDQSAARRTSELVRNLEGVAYVHSDEAGLSRARNLAVRLTSAPVLAFTDDDVTFEPSWPLRLASLLEETPEAGAVCGLGITPAGRQLPGAPAGTYRAPRSPFGLGSGFNLAFRREALEAAGPFDEELGAGARFRSAEDTDMLYRVMRAGWSVVCSDEVTVTHDDWRRGRAELRLHYGYGLGAGAQTAKHVAAGDPAAARIALRETRLHLATLARSLLLGRLRAAMVQPPYLVGMAVGYLSRRWASGGLVGADHAASRR
jgi:GT2 family glycosyltransferase